MDANQLIRACQQGNPEAREKLNLRLRKKMLGYSMYYSSGRAEEWDHLQDGFYHLFLNIGKYAFQGSFEGWMRRLFVKPILQNNHKRQPFYPISDQEFDKNGE